MDDRRRLAQLSLGLGLVVLYVGWGQAFELVGVGKACAVPDPRGLHLNGLGMLEYAVDRCPLQQYEYAWPAFGALSVIGLGLVWNARRLWK